MIKIYVNLYLFFKDMLSLVRLMKFILMIHNYKIFGSGDTADVLLLIQSFVMTEKHQFKSTILNNRTPLESTTLLSTLISEYRKSKSEVILRQLLEVLKVEFIQRENV